jgi:hypothetical protein
MASSRGSSEREASPRGSIRGASGRASRGSEDAPDSTKRRARREADTGTFGGEACRECGAPYEVSRGARSTERDAPSRERAEATDAAPPARSARSDEGAGVIGPSERDPNLGDVERPGADPSRGSRGFDEPSRRGRGPRGANGRESVEGSGVRDETEDENEEGPDERLGGFGPRGR